MKGTDENIINDTYFIGSGVQKSFSEKKLEPVLRVFYNRTAFQLPDNQRVRISLDTDLTFIREDYLDGVQRRQGNNWRRSDVGIDNPFPYIKEQEILRFPYAVLETKLQTHLGQEPPAWLTSLIEGHLVHEVPRFSKYLHGACYFFKDRLPLLPWWLSEMNVDIRKPRAENIGLTRSRSFKPLIDGRYRRAMIEETERKNKEAVINNENNNNVVPTDKAGGAQELNRRRSVSIDEKTAAAWRPTSNNNNKQQREEFTLIELNSTTPTTPTPKIPAPSAHNSIPKDRFASNTNSSRYLSSSTDLYHLDDNTPLQPPVTKFYQAGDNINGSTGRLVPSNEIVFKKQIGSPVQVADMDDDLEKGKRQKVKVRTEPKTFFANERTFIAWLQFCALLLTVALNLLNFGDSVSRIVGGVFIGLSAGIAIYALYRFEKRAWYVCACTILYFQLLIFYYTTG
jgi:hypothetical protein